MRIKDGILYNQINESIDEYSETRPLVGIEDPIKRECFIAQMIDSVRRIDYVRLIGNRQSNLNCTIPSDDSFNPLKAATWYKNNDNIDEAFWLIFLSTHFGHTAKSGWKLVKDVYSGMSDSITWDWININRNLDLFKFWLNQNEGRLKENGKFGNHRKYQNLDAYGNRGTGATFETYINWVNQYGSHENLINHIINLLDNPTPKRVFNRLYREMNCVMGFGRTGKFDFLTMIGKMGLANIEPDSAYMSGSTGPYSGAKILFQSNEKPRVLNTWLTEFEEILNLDFGFQVLEDAICNWQKNTSEYVYFRG
jgi:hypothetical protein